MKPNYVDTRVDISFSIVKNFRNVIQESQTQVTKMLQREQSFLNRILPSNGGQNFLDIGVVSYLRVVVLKNGCRALENKGASLAKSILHVFGHDSFDAHVINGRLVGISQFCERFLIVSSHHGIHSRWVPHGFQALVQSQSIAGDASFISKTKG